MADTVTLQVRMDRNLKEQMESMLADMGINVSTAINMYAKAIVNQARIPFELKVSDNYPNAESRRVIDNAREGKELSKAYSDLNEMWRDLDA